jgi:adenosylmethionine-8-amino-7-oxononanoate aminotransferase
MSAGARSAFSAPFDDLLFAVDFLPFPSEENKEEVLRKLEEYAAKGDYAAFIFEPLVQGTAGMRIYSEKVLDELIRIARKHEVICIGDEVMTGFGRTGKLFASDYLTEKPDILCLSKGLTGGTLPMGITTCNEKIVEAFKSKDYSKTFFHGHSFTGSPLGCAVANASLDLLLRKECLDNIQAISNDHAQFIKVVQKYPFIKKASSLGTILSLEIATGNDTSYFNQLRNQLYSYFLSKDVLLRPLGNVLYCLPPYIISSEERKRIYTLIVEFGNSLGSRS